MKKRRHGYLRGFSSGSARSFRRAFQNKRTKKRYGLRRVRRR
ncbi:hypothetical protein [Peromfec virus RodF8_56]|uniref:Uncharacterized protein n=1 Tax=Peromfec virus RodF8_56 TaxID=2929384 RepID=A0A976N228_9VIRU|nr:hypothetical protein [Peromfec virus RodF8_56]